MSTQQKINSVKKLDAMRRTNHQSRIKIKSARKSKRSHNVKGNAMNNCESKSKSKSEGKRSSSSSSSSASKRARMSKHKVPSWSRRKTTDNEERGATHVARMTEKPNKLVNDFSDKLILWQSDTLIN